MTIGTMFDVCETEVLYDCIGRLSLEDQHGN